MTTELETNLIDCARKLLALSIQVSEAINANDRKGMAAADQLYQRERLNFTLSIGAEHGLEGLNGIRLDLTDPRSGEAVVKLFEINAVPGVAH